MMQKHQWGGATPPLSPSIIQQDPSLPSLHQDNNQENSTEILPVPPSTQKTQHQPESTSSKTRSNPSSFPLVEENFERINVPPNSPHNLENVPSPGPDSEFHRVLPAVKNFFSLRIYESKSFKNKNAEEMTFEAIVKNPDENLQLHDLQVELKALFEGLLDTVREDFSDTDHARVFIRNHEENQNIIIPPTCLGELDAEVIMTQVENVLHSAESFPADKNLFISIAAIKTSNIYGHGRKLVRHSELDAKMKRCCISIKNKDDDLCLPRATVVALAHFNHKSDPQNYSKTSYYNCIRKAESKKQRDEARALRAKIQLQSEKFGTLDEVREYEKILGVGIAVVSSVAGNDLVYNGNENFENRLYLWHKIIDGSGHYDVLTKLHAFYGTPYYCHSCQKKYWKREHHKCKSCCNVCGSNSCFSSPNTVICTDCNMTCRSKACYDRHKKQKTNGRGKNKGIDLPSYCSQFWKCPQCSIVIENQKRNKKSHECGEMFCRICQQYFLNEHDCFMRAEASEVEVDKMLFFDYECMQNTGVHIPNLVVAMSSCSVCENNPVTDESKCSECGSRCEYCATWNEKEKDFERKPCTNSKSKCGYRKRVFSKSNVNADFYKFLITGHRNFTVVAHNSKGYDSYFIYNEMMKNGVTPDPIIFRGTKIMYMSLKKEKLRFVDSMNFIPSSLAALTKSFDLKELKKGFFPHLYNTPDHQNDKLNGLPHEDYYNPNGMKKERREEFYKWYNDHKNDYFDFAKELEEYCVSDVDILMQACLKFRKLLKEQTGKRTVIESDDFLSSKEVWSEAVDPFSYTTIASVCMGIFRTKFVPEQWKVLLKPDAEMSCYHEHHCKCVWTEARKTSAHSEIEVSTNEGWKKLNEVQFVKAKFVSSAIPLVPNHSLSGKDMYSKEGLQWIKWLEKCIRDSGKNVTIQSAQSLEGEKIVTLPGNQNKMIKYKLDGYFEFEGEKYALEYNGCNWHGCPRCFQTRRNEIKNGGKTMEQRFKETKMKEKRLKDAGFVVMSIWSCDFKLLLQKDPLYQKFVKDLDIQDVTNLALCFFGGRTNTLQLHKLFKKGEKGRYVDFTSLYPSVMKYGRFPIGKPKEKIYQNFLPKAYFGEPTFCEGEKCIYCIKSQDQTDISTNSASFNKIAHIKYPYFGTIKAKFLPPQNLYHPVLPIKANSKLFFPLCYSCAIENNQKNICDHSEEDRSFIGTFTTPEVEVALNVGYKIVKIYEIVNWGYENSVIYDEKTKSGGLFTDYINKFLKIKQQASGFPPDVNSMEEKQKYISSYWEYEGVELEENEIEKNSGLRSLAKLALNSFYGKFGQSSNLPNTKFVKDVGTLYQMITDDSIIITNFYIINEDVMMIEYKRNSEFQPDIVPGNVLICAFCTTYARIKLWSEMYKLGTRVIYHDTDSLIYVSNDNDSDEYTPKIGNFLGELTDELDCKEVGCSSLNCEGHWISEFVSCGPKNYSFKLNSGQITTKVRGFSLNYQTSKIINFESMKNSLKNFMNGNGDHLETVNTEIQRNKYDCKVTTKQNCVKKYSVIYNKRVLLPDTTTVPFGYKFDV